MCAHGTRRESRAAPGEAQRCPTPLPGILYSPARTHPPASALLPAGARSLGSPGVRCAQPPGKPPSARLHCIDRHIHNHVRATSLVHGDLGSHTMCTHMHMYTDNTHPQTRKMDCSASSQLYIMSATLSACRAPPFPLWHAVPAAHRVSCVHSTPHMPQFLLRTG